MLFALAFITNCPVVTQDGYSSPHAWYVNSTAVRLQVLLTSDKLEVSEFQSFNVTNTMVGPEPSPKDASGNCFMNALNAYETDAFRVNIESCNFVDFVFNISDTSVEVIEEFGEVFERKMLYVRVDGVVTEVELLQLLIVDDDQLVIGKIPVTNSNLQIRVNCNGYTVSSPLLSSFTCNGQKQSAQNGSVQVPLNCMNGTAVQINEAEIKVELVPSDIEYIEYEYAIGDVSISQEYKDGEVCTFIAEQIFLEAKFQFELENQPNCTDSQIIIALQCVDCMLGQINVNNICTDPLCEEGEIFEGGECQPIVCEEGYELINNNCVIIICEEGLNLENGVCIPIICNQDQVLVGSECVDIECKEDQEIVDGECVDGDVVMAVGLGLAGVMLALVFA